MAIVFGHEIHIFIPKFGQNSIFYSYGGGSSGLGIIPKKNSFFSASLRIILTIFTVKLMLTVVTKGGFEWWMGVVAVLLVLLLAVLIYLGVKAYQRRTTNLQAV